MSLNITDIITRFQTIANAHPNINSFGYGPIYDLDGYEMVYPYMWIRNDNAHTLVFGDYKFGAVEFQFIMRIGDKVNDQPNVFRANGENSNNGLGVMNDTFRILMDCLNTIMMNVNLFPDFDLITDISIEPFFHEDTGDVNGHQATITLRTKNDNKCLSPLTEKL